MPKYDIFQVNYQIIEAQRINDGVESSAYIIIIL
jgi:hypothetical protein